MAIIVDGRAQAAVGRRRAAGRDAALSRYIQRVQARRGAHVLAIDWADR